jgi:hypothetical protein
MWANLDYSDHRRRWKRLQTPLVLLILLIITAVVLVATKKMKKPGEMPSAGAARE